VDVLICAEIEHIDSLFNRIKHVCQSALAGGIDGIGGPRGSRDIQGLSLFYELSTLGFSALIQIRGITA
jgi:hypothetical protein